MLDLGQVKTYVLTARPRACSCWRGRVLLGRAATVSVFTFFVAVSFGFCDAWESSDCTLGTEVLDTSLF